MKINKANIIYSRTVQMRQFEPVTVSISMEAQIDPTDKVETVLATTKKLARAHVEQEVERLKVERKESYDNEMEKSI